MTGFWTFRRTVAAGVGAIVALNVIVAAIAFIGMSRVVDRKDRVIDVDSQVVLDVERLLDIRDARAAANRGYLISGEQSFLDEQYHYDTLFDAQLAEIRKNLDTARGQDLATQVATLQAGFVQLDKKPVQLREQNAPLATWSAAWEAINTEREATTASMNALSAYQQQVVDTRKAAASKAARADIRLILGVSAIAVLISALLGVVLVRRLRQRIGGAVQQVRSSSTALQATANEQAVGAQQQSTAVTEISTTMAQLLASSEQITGSAGRVAQTAGRTAHAGHEGTRTVVAAQGSIAQIGEQVSAVLDHMTQLGDKSNEIGEVIDIVAELAEQTNILAVNASIEAAGAGESGRRFGVVADEIRALADRVAESAGEIRELLEGVRGAVVTTARATRVQAGAVEAGTAQFTAMAASFEQILGMVALASEEANEIALSTAQQTIAVEQVTLAMQDVALAVSQTEARSSSTLRTVSELDLLSGNLQWLIDSRALPMQARRTTAQT